MQEKMENSMINGVVCRFYCLSCALTKYKCTNVVNDIFKAKNKEYY